MPLLTTRHELPGISSAVEGTLEGAGDSETNAIELVVPEGAETMVVTVTDIGSTGFLRGPTQVETRLTDPRGNRRDDLLRTGENGQRLLTLDDPEPGRWTLTLSSGGEARAAVDASILQRDAHGKMRRLGHYLQCKGCRVTIKAALIALLIELAPLVAAGLGIGEAIARLLAAGSVVAAAIARALGLDRNLLKDIGDAIGITIEDPIDVQLTRVCRFVRLCPG